MSLGELLRDERTRKGFGLNQLADRIGISPAYLSRVETGKLGNTPSEELRGKLATELGLGHDEVCRLARRIPSDVECYVLDNPGVLKRLRREMNRRSAS